MARGGIGKGGIERLILTWAIDVRRIMDEECDRQSAVYLRPDSPAWAVEQAGSRGERARIIAWLANKVIIMLGGTDRV